MDFGKLSCIYCKKTIEKPEMAVMMPHYSGKNFAHAACYSSEVMVGAGYVKKASPLSILGGGPSSPLAVKNSMEDLELKYGKMKERAEVQRSISGTMNIGIAMGIVFLAIGAYCFANAGRIKFDLVGWIALALLTLIGAVTLGNVVLYRIKLREFEASLNSGKKKG